MLVQSVQQLHLGPGELRRRGMTSPTKRSLMGMKSCSETSMLEQISYELVMTPHLLALESLRIKTPFLLSCSRASGVKKRLAPSTISRLLGVPVGVRKCPSCFRSWPPVARMGQRRQPPSGCEACSAGLGHRDHRRHDSTFAGQLALVKLGDWQFGFKQAKKFT